MRRALPLSVQLVLTFVGLILGLAAVLTTAAYTTLRANLETEATRNVVLATRTLEQTVTQLLHLRQQRIAGLLTSVESLCAEPVASGGLAWVDDCTRTMVNDFRRSERALGALLTYRNRRITRSGSRVSAAPRSGALADVIRLPDGSVEYIMSATQGQATL